jgi:hypothetical protein
MKRNRLVGRMRSNASWFLSLIAVHLIAADAFAKGICIPQGVAGSEKWQVKAVYLHGLIPPSGDISGNSTYSKSERDARARLQEWAIKNKMRIAVPISDEPGTYQGGNYLVWDKKSLKDIDQIAAGSCDGAWAQDRGLIAFSRATAGMSRNLEAACGGPYKKIYLIGNTDGKEKQNSCHSVVNHVVHDFDKASKNLDTVFSGILSSSSAPAAAPAALSSTGTK